MPGVFGQFDLQSEICAFRIEGNDVRDAINVALYEMSSEATVSAQRALEIYRAVAPQLFEIRASDCFLKQLEGQPIAAARTQRQAATIHGDALPGADVLGGFRRGDLQLHPRIAWVHGYNCANFFDQTREHNVTAGPAE